ncbi:murein L,D-transpeptidase catalytic domain family protein [Sphingopyxis alaskensis]|uniref:Twin-arginine translocation pathway signal n=1 Tax=Sphingopyxis alaskensis (strain DSM 13593 / LMG 18877 / RB2256) TaxID=317655 RepID=Q1GS33_SPHAL|nr:Twin-arginine translocation pathway signal [Sphingopyxis alaskensis RB2256]MCM3419190.1 murein L,D-transpeptidase catalytic domain family protein [Sphingopyxis alaskensis]
MNELIDRRALLAGLAGAGAVAAIPARAQLPNWVRQPVTPPPVDYLAVAKKQLAMQARNIPQTDRVGVVDFGLPSSRPRFALVDMVAGTVDLFPVTHGRGSDPQHDGWLKSFSNRVGSLATSRGAYRTSDYYWGANGSSMRLAGLEPDNSNADVRAIVVHGAWYADPALIATQGKLGRSEGCFVFGEELLPMILYKLGPGRLLFADRLSAPPPLPAPFDLPADPLPGMENLRRASSVNGPLPTTAD